MSFRQLNNVLDKQLEIDNVNAAADCHSRAVGEQLSVGGESGLAAGLRLRRQSCPSERLTNIDLLQPSQFALQCQNPTAVRQIFLDDIRTQMAQRVGVIQRSSEPERFPPQHLLFENILQRNERMYETGDILPQLRRLEPLTTQAFDGSMYSPGRNRSRDPAGTSSFASMGQRDFTSDGPTVPLRQREEMIRHHSERVDALRKEMATRKRIREDVATRKRIREDIEFVRRREQWGHDFRSARIGFETHTDPHERQTQFEEEHLKPAHRRSPVATGRTTEYDLCRLPQLQSSVDRGVNSRTTALSVQQSDSLVGLDLIDRSGEPPLFSAETVEIQTKSARKSVGAAEVVNKADKGIKSASQEAATSDDKPKATLRSEKYADLSHPSDKIVLSEYQCLIRESIEVFVIQPDELLFGAQRRGNSKIEAGQVGLRCRHCKHRPPHWRGQGASYFPGSLRGVYQASQNMNTNHFLTSCKDIPQALREQLVAAREKQRKEARRSGGLFYWVETCQSLGVEEKSEGKGLQVVS